MKEATVHITKDPINVAEVVESVTSHESGGIDVFIGTTRNHANDKSVVSLEYEAYEPMALKTMQALVEESRSRWPLDRVAVVHRIGKVPLGEASVVIAVSSAHRNEAFEACRYLIDRLKQEVPIWKKEYYADGTFEWSSQSRRSEMKA
ncbi:MAG: molybdenum cofactor biosynthesis protein MoaE [Bacteroidota bacterium]